MATATAVPRLNQLAISNSARLRTPPVIPHPMANLGDRSLLKIVGSASLDLGRPKTVAGYTSIPVASSFSWAESDLLEKPTRGRRYKKRAMATGSKSDEELLGRVTERLVDSFHGMKLLFKESDTDGGESVTQEGLLHVLYKTMGFVNRDKYYRMLKNLGLDKMQKISFDTFVSRFKEFEDIQKQWTPPIKRNVDAAIQSTAHPEENLRDCDVKEWGRLSVAPQATYHLIKYLKEKQIDMRAILPEDCYLPNGIVTKVQMRVSLQEIGLNLTDLEYKRFWDKYDPQNRGFLPLMEMYEKLGLTPEGEPKKRPPSPRTPILLKANTGIPARPAALAAREFALRRHKIRGSVDERDAALGGIRGQGISHLYPRPTDSKSSIGDEGEGDAKETPAVEAETRAKIRSALNQTTYHGKMECIIDCLNHKFEEKYNGLMMAFKIFDIYGDGCVMRYDFRRVLGEFAFPVAALQLTPLISKFGLSIMHGLINYRQLMTKLMNRTDGFTSLILDEKIQSTTSGGVSIGATSDTDVDAIARSLVEHLHGEYIKLAVALLRSDKSNKGVLPLSEVKEAFERCLGYSITEKQWEEVQTKLPYDADGNVRYIDLMVAFNGGEPGSWNLIKLTTVTVPRNRVLTTPPEEVKRLERSKSELPAKVKHHDNRPLEQLRKELVQFFTDHLHDVDKRFKELDRKSHRRFSKWQFGVLLKLCGFPVTEKELAEVWTSLKLSDDMMSTFNNVVMEFAPNFTSFEASRATHCQDSAEREAEGGAGEECRQQDEGGSPSKKDTTMEGSAVDPDFWDPCTITPRTFLTQIMVKARPAVRANFDSLRRSFRNNDPHGLGSITYKQMMNEIDKLNCGLTPEERNQLCSQFDFKNIGRCNYLAFMKAFTEPPSNASKLVYSPRIHNLEKKHDPIPRRAQKKPAEEPKPITVNEALVAIRKKVALNHYDCAFCNSSSKLIKHWKNLRRGFQKHDRSRTGKMSLADFKRVLKECEVPVSEEDLYHIFTEFDTNMNGLISYPEFLDALLKMG